MPGLANCFWVLFTKCLFCVFGFIVRFISRSETDENSRKNDCSNSRQDQIGFDSSNSAELESDDASEKKESHDFFFGFGFQNRETESSVLLETSKYQVVSSEDVRGFIEEPETMSLTIQEMFVGDSPIAKNGNQDSAQLLHLEKFQEFLVDSIDNSKENEPIINPFSADEDFQEFDSKEKSKLMNSISADEDFREFDSKAESVVLEKAEDTVESCENVLDNSEKVISTEFDLQENVLGPSNFSENQLSPSDSEPEPKVDSASIEEKELEFTGEIPNSEEVRIFDRGTVISREDSDDEYIELEPSFQFSRHFDMNFPRKTEENIQSTETELQEDVLGKSEEPSSQKKSSWVSDYEDDGDEFDILLKHQDLIEQMKLEMKISRNKGLPTILEECETPKMVEDLKPLRINEKWEHKDRVEEIQKVYKGYSEKMRKLDVLNYQTLHAISFLQLKDPIQQSSGQKSSVSTMKFLLFPNLWSSKLRRIYADPTLNKSISEMHRNLELVYVGQACLSWEILHWQYGKATELLELDSEGHRPYNHVAGEFQQLQVLVQRYVENEAFQGPRVQNYAKNRFDIRTLLQVPVVKDDCLKDNKDSSRVEEENPVSIAMLADIIDASMRVFWEFLRADKDETNVILKGLQPSHVDLQDPSDSELLRDIKTSLQKKEKRLKDILRSGNCIVKKFQKHQESRMVGALLLAQVELKLVSRVLNMSRLKTDQLVWCQKKLNKITFFNRKIRVEPSFLLFPF